MLAHRHLLGCARTFLQGADGTDLGARFYARQQARDGGIDGIRRAAVGHDFDEAIQRGNAVRRSAAVGRPRLIDVVARPRQIGVGQHMVVAEQEQGRLVVALARRTAETREGAGGDLQMRDADAANQRPHTFLALLRAGGIRDIVIARYRRRLRQRDGGRRFNDIRRHPIERCRQQAVGCQQRLRQFLRDIETYATLARRLPSDNLAPDADGVHLLSRRGHRGSEALRAARRQGGPAQGGLQISAADRLLRRQDVLRDFHGKLLSVVRVDSGRGPLDSRWSSAP